MDSSSMCFFLAQIPYYAYANNLATLSLNFTTYAKKKLQQKRSRKFERESNMNNNIFLIPHQTTKDLPIMSRQYR